MSSSPKPPPGTQKSSFPVSTSFSSYHPDSPVRAVIVPQIIHNTDEPVEASFERLVHPLVALAWVVFIAEKQNPQSWHVFWAVTRRLEMATSQTLASTSTPLCRECLFFLPIFLSLYY
jgi:hypothetical protein